MKKAFTLIEVLVVVSIISLLSSVVISSTSSARSSAINSRIKQEMVQIRDAFELVKNPDGTYPFSTDGKLHINMSYNSETQKLYNDIIASNKGQYFFSFANNTPPNITKYSIYASLLPENSTYVCIDSDFNTSSGPNVNLGVTALTNGGYCR
jgi:prepilin-type N-terminal cleavage/methylation domain-containing protein